MLETRSSPFLVGAPKRSRLVANNSQAIKRSPVIGKTGAPSKPVVVADPTPSANRGGKPSPSTGAAGPGGTDAWLTPRSEPQAGLPGGALLEGQHRRLKSPARRALRHARGVRAAQARRGIPGLDIAGQVEAVGGAVRQFRPGDKVFGWCKGAFAEYASAGEDSLLPKPANLTIEQSAAVGDSAT